MPRQSACVSLRMSLKEAECVESVDLAGYVHIVTVEMWSRYASWPHFNKTNKHLNKYYEKTSGKLQNGIVV